METVTVMERNVSQCRHVFRRMCIVYLWQCDCGIVNTEVIFFTMCTCKL